MVLSTQLEYAPGTRYVYSDLGADLLGFVVEAISGERLDQFLEHRLFAPLGMTDTHFRPADSLRYRIAPTELHPPRGYPLQGEVHDENAYALGGIAGHAGLFSTAADLSVFAQMMLNGGEYDGKHIFSDSTVAVFTRRTAGHRALGWDTADGDFGSGQYLTERAYGHTGFTGTSMWIDPDREMFVILLTNRVHGATAKRPAKVISDVRSDLSDAAVLAVVDTPAGAYNMPSTFRADRELGWNVPIRPLRAKNRAAARGKVVRHSRVHSSRKSGAKQHSSAATKTANHRSSHNAATSSKKHHAKR
jgi:CubicO group peptidase (beta-lactamase class C family)